MKMRKHAVSDVDQKMLEWFTDQRNVRLFISSPISNVKAE